MTLKMGSCYRIVYCRSDCLSNYFNILEAAFPGLARNTAESRDKAEQYQAGKISRADYDYADTLKRSELSNMSFYIQSIGEIVILAVIVGIMFSVDGSLPFLSQWAQADSHSSYS
jgi:hypothetical protein